MRDSNSKSISSSSKYSTNDLEFWSVFREKESEFFVSRAVLSGVVSKSVSQYCFLFRILIVLGVYVAICLRRFRKVLVLSCRSIFEPDSSNPSLLFLF